MIPQTGHHPGGWPRSNSSASCSVLWTLVCLAVPGDEEPVEDRLGPCLPVVDEAVGDGEHGNEVLEVSPPALLALAGAAGVPIIAWVGRAEYVELGFLVHGGWPSLSLRSGWLQPNFHSR